MCISGRGSRGEIFEQLSQLFLPGQWSLYSKQSLSCPWPSSQGKRARSRSESSHGQAKPCSWGRGRAGAEHSLPFCVTAALQREGHGVEGAVSQVWVLGALPAAAAAALSALTSLHAALLPPPRSLQGTAARALRVPGPFLRRLPKQVACAGRFA